MKYSLRWIAPVAVVAALSCASPGGKDGTDSGGSNSGIDSGAANNGTDSGTANNAQEGYGAGNECLTNEDCDQSVGDGCAAPNWAGVGCGAYFEDYFCESDADCEENAYCRSYRGPCAEGSNCLIGCRVAGCPAEGTECNADTGLCDPSDCDDSGYCPEGLTCTHADDADERGCTRPGCSDDNDCDGGVCWASQCWPTGAMCASMLAPP